MGSPPPIVFITTDTQGRDMVSAYGPAHWHRPRAAGGAEVELPATPNIDRLAARGTLFDTCVVAAREKNAIWRDNAFSQLMHSHV